MHLLCMGFNQFGKSLSDEPLPEEFLAAQDRAQPCQEGILVHF